MTTCSYCGQSFQQIGTHWRWNPEHRPSFTDEQHEILKGIIMGDACVNDNGGNPCIKISVIRKRYLEYLHNKFSEVSRGVELDRTAEELAEANRKTGFSPSADSKNYNDIYIWHTTNHPELKQYRDWYSGGKKELPKSVNLSPKMLTHWYCCDGTLNHNKYPSIAMSNESENMDHIVEIFDDVGIDVVPNISEYHHGEYNSDSARIDIPSRSVDDFFNYIEGALPGFEYKWPEAK